LSPEKEFQLGWPLNICYLVLLVLASPWIIYRAMAKGKYREGFAAKFLGRVPRRAGDEACVWLHAVSVGEVNLLAPVLAELLNRHPQLVIRVSTTTKAGYDLAKSKFTEHTVFYCPLDFSWAVRAALRRIRPDVLLLAELELWPNLVRLAHRRGTSVAVVNGRLSEKSFNGYRKIRPLMKHLFRKVDVIAVQSEEYAERFRQLGAAAEAVHVTGSVKFDGAVSDRTNSATTRLAELAGIESTDVVFLAGSTQDPEERFALSTFNELSKSHPDLRLIVVPRHPERFEAVTRLLDEFGLPWQRRSQLNEGKNRQSPRILLVDVVGELGAWWGCADIGFVGGSMGSRGGQNMIEAAAYGTAVSFGPNTKNFRDVVGLLLAEDAAVVVGDRAEMTQFVRRCLEDRDWAALLGERARRLVSRQTGATVRTVDLLDELFRNKQLAAA
jgi:3-deoxy-D-manno-octulosonic-acid transferase